MSTLSDHFSKAARVAGIAHDRCGPAVRDLLLDLRQRPLPAHRPLSGGVAMPRGPSMGVAIRAGLARYVSDAGCYAITPAGETWLQELEIHGLLHLGRDAS